MRGKKKSEPDAEEKGGKRRKKSRGDDHLVSFPLNRHGKEGVRCGRIYGEVGEGRGKRLGLSLTLLKTGGGVERGGGKGKGEKGRKEGDAHGADLYKSPASSPRAEERIGKRPRER